MNKHICMITTVHKANDVRIFKREAQALAEQSYNVTVIGNYDQTLYLNGVHIIALPEYKSRLARIFKSTIIAYFKAIKVNADVYHIHDPELIMVGMLLKSRGKKVVYDIHENVSAQMIEKEWLPPITRKLISKVSLLLEKLAIKVFDAIIVAGEDIRNQKHFLPYISKIFLIRNYPTYINDGNINLEMKNRSKITYIYTGGMTETRGIRNIVKAFQISNLQCAQLILLGRFDTPDFEKEIVSLIMNDSRIKYIPSVPYEEMFKILAKCSVGLICFYSTPNNIGALTGRNNKFYEYLYSGLAVIGSNLPGWQDVIEGNGVGVVVDPTNENEISSAMISLASNPDRMQDMRKRSLEMGKRNSWSQESLKLIELYRRLLAN